MIETDPMDSRREDEAPERPPATPVGRRRGVNLALGLLLLSVVLVAGVLAANGGALLGRQPLHGTELQPSKPAPDFRLLSATGQPVQLSALKGKVVVLYFGYTFCPDICPMTLAKLAQARAQIGEPAADIQVAMITVDPERDTPEVLGRYVTNFDRTFLGLSGSPDEIQAVASAYGVYFRKNAGSAATGYLVDHTATALVIDRQGALRLVLSPTLEGPQIADDLRTLLGRRS